MPVILKEDFPVAEALRSPRDGVCRESALRIGIVNLMPLKERTESDLLRILDNYPLPLEVDFIAMESHRSKNSSQERVDRHYVKSSEAIGRRYDGLIVTGAPVELMPFEEVDYWEELTALMDHAAGHVKSTMYVCWGAFAGLYHRYGIAKRVLPTKLSGVYRHDGIDRQEAVTAGFDAEFDVPHSRNTEVDTEAVMREPELKVTVASPVAGPHLITGRGGREFYVMGHWEYAPDTLDMEYRRDTAKGLNPAVPANYYRDDNPDAGYCSCWHSHGNLFFMNWLTHYVK